MFYGSNARLLDRKAYLNQGRFYIIRNYLIRPVAKPHFSTEGSFQSLPDAEPLGFSLIDKLREQDRIKAGGK